MILLPLNEFLAYTENDNLDLDLSTVLMVARGRFKYRFKLSGFGFLAARKARFWEDLKMRENILEKKTHKEGAPNKGILCATISVSIIASVEDAVKVLTLKCLNQYPYKRLST